MRARYKDIRETTKARTFKEILKFNPYHDARGRFSTANAATSFTYKPGASRAHDLAIERERKRQEGTETAPAKKPAPKKPAAPVGNQTLQDSHPKGNYGKYGLGTEAVKQCQKLTGADKAEAKTLLKATHQFTTSDYENIRKYQQAGPPPDRKQVSAEIESFISKSPKWDGGEVYRGLGVDKATAEKIVADAKAGKTIGMRGTSSWTSTYMIADSFAESNGAEVSIIFKSSGKQNGTSVRYLSKYPIEDEVLMSKDAKWKPVKVEKLIGSTYVIECEPIN